MKTTQYIYITTSRHKKRVITRYRINCLNNVNSILSTKAFVIKGYKSLRRSMQLLQCPEYVENLTTPPREFKKHFYLHLNRSSNLHAEVNYYGESSR